MHSGRALSQLGPALMGPSAWVIYSRLFKYTQQHTAGFTENSNDYNSLYEVPHLLRLALIPDCTVTASNCSMLLRFNFYMIAKFLRSYYVISFNIDVYYFSATNIFLFGERKILWCVVFTFCCCRKSLSASQILHCNQARCTWYNIMWSSLSMTCSKSVVFSGYSGFLYQ